MAGINEFAVLFFAVEAYVPGFQKQAEKEIGKRLPAGTGRKRSHHVMDASCRFYSVKADLWEKTITRLTRVPGLSAGFFVLRFFALNTGK